MRQVCRSFLSFDAYSFHDPSSKVPVLKPKRPQQLFCACPGPVLPPQNKRSSDFSHSEGAISFLTLLQSANLLQNPRRFSSIFIDFCAQDDPKTAPNCPAFSRACAGIADRPAREFSPAGRAAKAQTAADFATPPSLVKRVRAQLCCKSLIFQPLTASASLPIIYRK
jgi:hypothetical protein